MAKDSAFKYDFNRVTYREMLELELGEGSEDELTDEEKSLRTDESLELVARVLVEWPFDEEITVENMKDLGLEDFGSLQRSFRTAMNKIFQGS